jgi:hypothetical protein
MLPIESNLMKIGLLPDILDGINDDVERLENQIGNNSLCSNQKESHSPPSR